MDDLQRAIKWLESEEQRVSQAMATDSIPKEFIFARAVHLKNCRALLDALRWIPVSERLPCSNVAAASDDVIVRTASGYWHKAVYYMGKWYSDGCRSDAVTHWMPVPEPPKGDD